MAAVCGRSVVFQTPAETGMILEGVRSKQMRRLGMLDKNTILSFYEQFKILQQAGEPCSVWLNTAEKKVYQ